MRRGLTFLLEAIKKGKKGISYGNLPCKKKEREQFLD